MIRVEGLVKCYGKSDARSVDDLSFHVPAGEVFAFLGPNGAGKSTTAKVLTTLMAPTAGTATVAGFDVVRESRKVRERIGYVAQSTGIDHFMTGRENLMLIGRLYHLKTAELERRVAQMLDFFGLTAAANDMAATYSGGMQRKLDIATALLHRPDVLFLDEPTLGLDAQSRIDLWNYVRRLNVDMGVTVFLTTHYLDEADKLAHRVGIIDAGRLQAVGTPTELKDMLQGDSIALAFDDDLAERARPLLTDAPFSKEVLDEEDGLRVYVDHGGEAIPALISLLSNHNLTVRSVTLARPTLDDVFIKFTGKSMDKVEEKVKPWWAQWAGDDWEQQALQSEWKGNKWVNSDGSAKDPDAFEEWSASQDADDVPDGGTDKSTADAGPEDADAESVMQDNAVAAEEQDMGDPTDKDSNGSDETAGSGGWKGNEWVNADGSPKDPEAMAKWLKDGAAKKTD